MKTLAAGSRPAAVYTICRGGSAYTRLEGWVAMGRKPTLQERLAGYSEMLPLLFHSQPLGPVCTWSVNPVSHIPPFHLNRLSLV